MEFVVIHQVRKRERNERLEPDNKACVQAVEGTSATKAK